MENRTNPKGIASEAILIAGLTGIGYFAACAYQAAYLWYFNIPLLFLNINLSLVLLVGLVGLVLTLGNITLFSWLIGRKNNAHSTKRISILFAAVFQIALPILIIVTDPTHPWRSVILILTVIIAFILFIIKARKNLKKDLISKDGVDILLDKFEEKFGTLATILLISGFFFVIFGAGAGWITAKMKTNFLVSDSSPNTAIISNYGNDFVGLVFDPNTGKLGNEIKLVSDIQLSTSTVFKIESLPPTYSYDR